MNFREKLSRIAEKNDSRLCVGLDLDPAKVPVKFGRGERGALNYGRFIIRQTSDLVCAYKPNIAFFEDRGIAGLRTLEKILSLVPSAVPVILDAKRGDIGNTSGRYAAAVFERWNADAVTVSPYMGRDSLEPFFQYADKHVFVLVLTSNPGSADFQLLETGGKPLYLSVAKKVREWNTAGNIGIVAGATHPDSLRLLRQVLPSEIFLIPGLGAQAGDAEKSVAAATEGGGEGIFNVSRDIIFPKNMVDPEQVRKKAEEYRGQIRQYSGER